MFRRLILSWLAILFASAALAQAPIQQSGSRLDSAILVQTSATSAATITIPVPAGQYAYITAIDIANCAGTAVTAAAVLTITTTNLNGVAWTVGTGSTAGLCQPSPAAGNYANPIKSQAPGTNVTVVLPTFTTNQTIRATLYYYTAP